MMNKIPLPLRWVLAPIAFWAIVILVPYVLNFVYYYLLSAFLGEIGDIVRYLIVSPTCYALACCACYFITPNNNFVMTVVNATVLIVLVLIDLVLRFFLPPIDWWRFVVSVLCIASTVFACVYVRRTEDKGGDDRAD